MRIEVGLPGGRGYEIHIGEGLLERAPALLEGLARSRRVVIVSQPRLWRRQGEALLEALRAAGWSADVLLFPSGERHKHLGTIARLYGGLYNLPEVDRKTLIVAFGGGVVGDVAGYVAATYLRGLDYVQVPTTLLAMVDSAVGGKTGVDFREGKNLVGAFHQPGRVLCDLRTLTTLPAREWRSGLAEVVKYGVIAEPELLEFLMASASALKKKQSGPVSSLVARSCAIKAAVVGADEREESGRRAILNFGHTIGHALEAATGYRRYRHGEAVAVGMMSAACIGEVAGVTEPPVRQKLSEVLSALGLPRSLPGDISDEALLALTRRDKKAAAGRARFVLARSLGTMAGLCDLSDDVVRAGLARHRAQHGEREAGAP